MFFILFCMFDQHTITTNTGCPLMFVKQYMMLIKRFTLVDSVQDI